MSSKLMGNYPEKPVGVRSLVTICLLLSLVLILVTVRSLEALHSGVATIQTRRSECTGIKIVPEWQAPAVVADRESENLHDYSYGVPRRFMPMGTATFLFVHFSTHRVAPNSFAVSGLGAKALFLYSNPSFLCSWHPLQGHSAVTQCNGTVLQPASSHVSYGKQYTGTVVYCTFDTSIGSDGLGGHLQVLATHGTTDSSGLEYVSFVAKVEAAGDYNASNFHEPYQFDHVYCGAPLYGSLNPQRIREWIAYHVLFFGERTHFFMYDAGGIDAKVRGVLQPWVALGRVTIMNVRQEARYNSHYHNQFVILNDCLFRSRTMASWAWFFDVDEFIYRPQGSNLNALIQTIDKYFGGKRLQRVSMKQMAMDHQHCRGPHAHSEWGIDKMVYRRTQVTEPGGYPDRKSFVRADSALATGPHEPVAMRMPAGATETHQVTSWEDQVLVYYHFHNVSDKKEWELCQELVDSGVNVTSFHNVSHQFDDSLKLLVDQVEQFELQTIGPLPNVIST